MWGLHPMDLWTYGPMDWGEPYSSNDVERPSEKGVLGSESLL
jgi:hypothetical protein